MTLLLSPATWNSDLIDTPRRRSLQDVFAEFECSSGAADYQSMAILNDVPVTSQSMWLEPTIAAGESSLTEVPRSPLAEVAVEFESDCLVPDVTDVRILDAGCDFPEVMDREFESHNPLKQVSELIYTPMKPIEEIGPSDHVAPTPQSPPSTKNQRKQTKRRSSAPSGKPSRKATVPRARSASTGQKSKSKPQSSRGGKSKESVKARKRDGNRRAAKKFRLKQKAHELELVQSLDGLMASNNAMTLEMKLIMQIIAERR